MVAFISPDCDWANELAESEAMVSTTAIAILDFIVFSSGPIARDSATMRGGGLTLNARAVTFRGEEVISM
jgi:hypothetical protein